MDGRMDVWGWWCGEGVQKARGAPQGRDLVAASPMNSLVGPSRTMKNWTHVRHFKDAESTHTQRTLFFLFRSHSRRSLRFSRRRSTESHRERYLLPRRRRRRPRPQFPTRWIIQAAPFRNAACSSIWAWGIIMTRSYKPFLRLLCLLCHRWP